MDATNSAEELLRVVNGDAWHGSSLRELLDGLTAEHAFAHPLPERHSIWEIVNHITVWHETVKHRINGKDVDPNEEDDWPLVSHPNEATWHRTCEKLYKSADEVAHAIRSITATQMNETVPGKSYTWHVMISGLASHDAYHSGQISLLRKTIETSRM